MLPSLLALLLFTPLANDDSDSWPQFRGPGARGVSQVSGLPVTWTKQDNVAWKVAIPGRGWSSPVVFGDRIFVTSAVAEKGMPEPKHGLYPGRSTTPDEPYEWVVMCLDLHSGKTLWSRTVHSGSPPSSVHIKNTYASETPVVDEERVYAYFGNVGLFAFSHSGKPLWERKWDPVKTQQGWGTASSPALDGDRLYIINDNEEQSFLEAMNKKTGKTIWTVERDERSNWSTPFVWRTKLRTEIVTPGTGKVRSYDVDGKLLWSLKGMSGITIATPYESHGLLYITSGFVMSRNKPVYAIKPGAAGDISLKDGENSNEHIAWAQGRAAPYNPSTIVVGDHLYSLQDFGTLACYDARTGEEHYSRQRVRARAGFTSSPFSYGGHLFCLDEEGRTSVVKLGPKFEVLHTNELGEMCMASPAITERGLLIRTLTQLYCIAKPKQDR